MPPLTLEQVVQQALANGATIISNEYGQQIAVVVPYEQWLTRQTPPPRRKPTRGERKAKQRHLARTRATGQARRGRKGAT